MTDSLANIDSVLTAITAAMYYEFDKSKNNHLNVGTPGNYYVVPLVFIKRKQFDAKHDIRQTLLDFAIEYSDLLFL